MADIFDDVLPLLSPQGRAMILRNRDLDPIQRVCKLPRADRLAIREDAIRRHRVSEELEEAEDTSPPVGFSLFG